MKLAIILSLFALIVSSTYYFEPHRASDSQEDFAQKFENLEYLLSTYRLIRNPNSNLWQAYKYNYQQTFFPYKDTLIPNFPMMDYKAKYLLRTNLYLDRVDDYFMEMASKLDMSYTNLNNLKAKGAPFLFNTVGNNLQSSENYKKWNKVVFIYDGDRKAKLSVVTFLVNEQDTGNSSRKYDIICIYQQFDRIFLALNYGYLIRTTAVAGREYSIASGDFFIPTSTSIDWKELQDALTKIFHMVELINHVMIADVIGIPLILPF